MKKLRIKQINNKHKNDFENSLKKNKIYHCLLGKTGGKKLIINNKKIELVNLDIKTIREIWHNPIWNFMG